MLSIGDRVFKKVNEELESEKKSTAESKEKIVADYKKISDQFQPCSGNPCPSDASCSVVGKKAKCTCNHGYFTNPNDKTCIRIVKKIKSTLHLRKPFTHQLHDSSSSQFKSLAAEVKSALLSKLKLVLEPVNVSASNKQTDDKIGESNTSSNPNATPTPVTQPNETPSSETDSSVKGGVEFSNEKPVKMAIPIQDVQVSGFEQY